MSVVLTMKKEDLKEGMLVEYRDGRLRKVQLYQNELIVNSDNGYTELNNFSEDLLESHHSELDIVRVYRPNTPSPCNFFRFDLHEFDLIWERYPSPVEISLKEVAKKFNIDIKKLKIVEK